jgi:beta-ribofuranosylaminobenzene 5'-phosphate synthase
MRLLFLRKAAAIFSSYRTCTIRSMTSPASCVFNRGAVVVVASRARIHCGLLNTSGLYGRVDGGLGFSVDSPRWELEVGAFDLLDQDEVPQEIADAVSGAVIKLRRLWGLPPFAVRVRNGIAPHAGLGSKTALLLAIGRAASMLASTKIATVALARLLGRGGTSGIGVHCFDRGGLVWDAGHAYIGKKAFAPSSASRADPPSAIVQMPVKWLSVVHFRFAPSSIHGDAERRAFRRECPTSNNDTVQALVAVSSLILPGVLDRRDEHLQRGLRILQETGFKKVEWEYQDFLTRAFRRYWASSKEPETLCLSSFGPTMFVLTTNPRRALARINGFGEQLQHLTVTWVSSVGCQVRKDWRTSEKLISTASESTNI